MGSVPVVKRQEPVQRPLQGAGRGVVVPAERDTPVLMEDRALQPFHEAVGPRMARLDPGVRDLVGRTRRDEPRFALLAVVGQHAPQPPPRRPGSPAVRPRRGRTGSRAAVTSPTMIRGPPVRRGRNHTPSTARPCRRPSASRCRSCRANTGRPAAPPRHGGPAAAAAPCVRSAGRWRHCAPRARPTGPGGD